MKTRNWVLGLSAVVFAVGTGVASSLVAQTDAFIVVKNSASDESYICRNSGADCEQNGTFDCKVTVSTSINTGTKTVKAHLTNACTTPLKNDQDAAEGGTISVYDALDELPNP